MRVVAVTAAIAVLAAPAFASSGEPPDSCDLLKRAEIEDVLGQAAAKPEGVGEICYWQLGRPEATEEAIGMTLLVERGKGAKAGYNQGLDAIRPDVLAEVDLGKDAYFAVGSLAVLKNKKTAFYISGVFDQAQAEELAGIVLDRL
ncbi:MAG TPA: hypothetical protein VMQ81_02295 [Acidimicrobiia bacterium]|nr:hypothetical protein [Acidimicrobiia bacterium]